MNPSDIPRLKAQCAADLRSISASGGLPADIQRERIELLAEVLELCDGHGEQNDATLMPWRVGSHIPRNVYAMVGDEPSDDDIDIGRFDSESVAAIAVLHHNNALKEL